jgi:GTP-binding protein
MVHYLDDKNINTFREAIKKNNYEVYDIYMNIPEFLFLGRSNVGKSSLINALLSKKATVENKTPGKTQKIEFFLLKDVKNVPKVFVLDAPGFGYIEGPVILKRKFKYLIYTYLNYAVRLKRIYYLINGEHGLKQTDKKELKFLNNFDKDIQLVFTKIDKLNKENMIKNIAEASSFTKSLKNVRPEIFLTSARTKYGIDNLRTNLYLTIQKPSSIKNLLEGGEPNENNLIDSDTPKLN